MKIDAAVMSVNDNPAYIKYWKYASRIWQEGLGIKPYLIICEGNGHVNVDSDGYGEIIRVKKSIYLGEFMQVSNARYYGACFIKGNTILSDLDLLPMSRKRFTTDIASIPNDSFLWLYSLVYGYFKQQMFCYNVASDKLRRELFDVTENTSFEDFVRYLVDYVKDIPKANKTLYGDSFRNLDELSLTKATIWNKTKNFIVKMIDFPLGRIPKNVRLWLGRNEKYVLSDLQNGYYLDAHKFDPDIPEIRNKLHFMLNNAFGFDYPVDDGYVDPNCIMR